MRLKRGFVTEKVTRRAFATNSSLIDDYMVVGGLTYLGVIWGINKILRAYLPMLSTHKLYALHWVSDFLHLARTPGKCF